MIQNLLRVILSTLCLFSIVFSPARTAANGSQDTRMLSRWLEYNRDSKTLLPYSHVGDSRLRHWTMTYDSGVTALAYLALERTEEAQKIIDFYINTPRVWRLGGIIDGINIHKPDLGVSWTVRTGSNTWIGLAALHLYNRTKEDRYRDLAVRIGDFLLYLQNKNHNIPNYGGIRMGPAGDPKIPTDQRLNYSLSAPRLHDIFSTEHNVTAFAFLNMLFDTTRLERFARARKRVWLWLKEYGFNTQGHYFNRGSHASGRRDTVFATDVQSWALSALGQQRLEQLEPGLTERLLQIIQKNALNRLTFQNKNGVPVKISGVDFVDHETAAGLGRDPLISPEWTFQLATAISSIRASDQFLRLRDELNSSMLTLAKSQSQRGGLPYATSGDVPIGHEYNTPRLPNQSVIGVSYGILSLTEFDPLSPAAQQ
ncbi:MAG: hypothetical protein ACLFPX_00725 [Candidatus Omnitrophota bacterium]